MNTDERNGMLTSKWKDCPLAQFLRINIVKMHILLKAFQMYNKIFSNILVAFFTEKKSKICIESQKPTTKAILRRTKMEA